MGTECPKILNPGNISAECEETALFHCTVSIPLKQLQCDEPSDKLGLDNNLLLQLSYVMVGVLRRKRMGEAELGCSSPE